ncbi:S8 family serine peptidase [Candidatus Woesearchaeota archaeon]|nr:S8 family serine peptidase [Candidatus Woesearchaeota archaeon]
MLGRGESLRKEFIFVLLFLMLLAVGNAGDINSDKVDGLVVETLESDDNIDVVVILKDVQADYNILTLGYNPDNENIIQDLGFSDDAYSFSMFNGFSTRIDSDDLERLVDDERVEKIYYKREYKINLQDSIPLINASLVHPLKINSENLTGAGETVCILDTGVNYTHPDLGGCFGNNCKIIGGYDFVNNDNDPIDDQGHGTHVTGIVAGNGTLNGVAPDANIVAVKVCDSSGDCNFVNEGIDWCVSNAVTYNISIISMSLGGGLYESACDSDSSVDPVTVIAVDNATSQNIFVSVSSGNDGNTTAISSPACIGNSTSVGSTDKNDLISSFTNRASILDLLAPGGSINSTSMSSLYELRSGTSMAAPHVSGAAAVLMQFFRLETGNILTPNETLGNLTEYGFTITDSGGSELNFQRIDVYNSTVEMDVYSPRVDISLTNETLEIASENLTISIDYLDVFFDSKTSNVSYPDGSLLADFTDSIELTSENLTDIGVYTIVAWANDSSGNENLTTKTFTVQDTSEIPVVTAFNYPAESPNYSATSEIFFNVSIGSKYNLSNATLYHNFTDWHANGTLDLDANETSAEFNSSFADGVYLWGVEACDVNNECNFSENRTLIVDLTDPIVALISPLNDTTLYTDSASFNYNVSDYTVSSCDLLIDDAVSASDTSVSLNAQETISKTLSNGNYSWAVGCFDNTARSSNSSAWKLTICKPSWSCGAWSDEDDACGTRTCTDSNSCGTDIDKPSTSKSCDDDSGGSSTAGGSAGGAAGGAATTTATDKSVLKFQANAGDVKSFGISKDVGISGLDLEFKNAVTNAEVTVEKQDEQPSGTSAVDNVYKYIKININFVDTDLKEAKIKFNVPKSWITINALNDPTKIFMSRYNDGKWQKLETLTAGIEEENQKYEAITPGFSYFAVSANKVAGAADVTGETVAASDETEIAEEKIKTDETSEKKKNIFSMFTGGAIKNLFNERTNLYYIIAGVLVVVILFLIIFKFKSKLKFLGFFSKIFSPFKKIFSSKFFVKPFVGLRKVETKIMHEKRDIKRALKIHHKDRITREKEMIEEEKRKLEEEKKEIAKLRKEEEMIRIRDQRERERREKEMEKQRDMQERERRKEEEMRLRGEKERVRKERKEIEKQEKVEKKKKFEEGFRIKHAEEDKWEDFELEDSD